MPPPTPGGKAVDKNALTNKILHEIYGLYTHPASVDTTGKFGSVGLEQISKEARLPTPLLHPRRRVTVMIVGNHSAGKSTFVNWYCEEPIQSTGVAVESQGFTIIRSGTDEQDVKGQGALVDNDHIRAVTERLPAADRKRFVDHLAMLVRTSTAKDFPRIDLIDTPGLVDGHVVYPFDVNRVIVELASIADLILVFLDPIGQALCSRTMNVVKELNDRGHADKMRYYLTKADTVARREDLNKVIVQVTQNLSLRVSNTHGFDVPCIWIPSEAAALVPHTPPGGAGASSSRTTGSDLTFSDHRTVAGEVNSLGRLCTDISRTIGAKVQANMTACTTDCSGLVEHLERELERERGDGGVKRTWVCYTWALRPWFLVLGALTFLDVLHHVAPRLPASLTSAPVAASLLASSRPVIQVLRGGCDLLLAVGDGHGSTLQQRLTAAGGAFLLLAVLLQFFLCRVRGLRTRTHRQLGELGSYVGVVEVMRLRVEGLYREYVRAAQVPEYSFGPNGVVLASSSAGKARGGASGSSSSGASGSGEGGMAGAGAVPT